MNLCLPNQQQGPIRAFQELIAGPKANENAIQDFLESNTAFMPTPNLLNHGLHMNTVITKFPIGERTTDYAFLTKSSIKWQLSLVELEDSNKKIFKNSSKNVAFTSDFNDAIAQMDVWRDYVKNNHGSLIEKLYPLLVPRPMDRNDLSVNFVLVIGRSTELEHDESRRQRLATYESERRLTVLRYDSIIGMVEQGISRPKAVIRANSRGYLLESVEGLPKNMFSHIKPEHLSLSPLAETRLRAEGFDIDAWRRNELLILNDKWSLNTEPSLREAMNPFLRNYVTSSYALRK